MILTIKKQTYDAVIDPSKRTLTWDGRRRTWLHGSAVLPRHIHTHLVVKQLGVLKDCYGMPIQRGRRPKLPVTNMAIRRSPHVLFRLDFSLRKSEN